MSAPKANVMREFMYREFGDEHEAHHWWFRARRAIVRDMLQRRYHGAGAPVVDLGCGTGGMLPLLSEFGPVVGLDPAPLAREYCRTKLNMEVIDGSLPDRVPLASDHYGLAALFDVIEHVDDDVATLREAWRILKPGGLAVITVPACPWLWARHDEVNEHKRRYTRAELQRKILQAGFRAPRLSYYNFWFLPAIATVRLGQKLAGRFYRPSPDNCDLSLSPRWINRILEQVMSSERFLLRYLRLPWGASLIATAEKPEN